MLRQAAGLVRQAAAFQQEAACIVGCETFRQFSVWGEAPHPVYVPSTSGRVHEKFAHTEFPEHYRQIPVLYASYRSETLLPSGTWASRKLRVAGYVTGALESLPCDQPNRMLVYPDNEITTIFKQYGASFLNQICCLRIIPLHELRLLMQTNTARNELFEKGWSPTPLDILQVLPRRLQLSPVHRDLINLTVMHSPNDRIVHCQVPVTPINADESPCVKRGGSPMITTHFVTVRSAASNIPLVAEIDCASLESGDIVRTRDLQLAEGQHIIGIPEGAALMKMIGGKKPM